jgi:nucleoside-diphosphate-sugar epimerase
MKTLVVGGTSFASSCLVKALLNAGKEVRVLDLNKRLLVNNRHSKLYGIA